VFVVIGLEFPASVSYWMANRLVLAFWPFGTTIIRQILDTTNELHTVTTDYLFELHAAACWPINYQETKESSIAILMRENVENKIDKMTNLCAFAQILRSRFSSLRTV